MDGKYLLIVALLLGDIPLYKSSFFPTEPLSILFFSQLYDLDTV